jgi:hypothetical protein
MPLGINGVEALAEYQPLNSFRSCVWIDFADDAYWTIKPKKTRESLWRRCRFADVQGCRHVSAI